jgi:hypothetical protein
VKPYFYNDECWCELCTTMRFLRAYPNHANPGERVIVDKEGGLERMEYDRVRLLGPKERL